MFFSFFRAPCLAQPHPSLRIASSPGAAGMRALGAVPACGGSRDSARGGAPWGSVCRQQLAWHPQNHRLRVRSAGSPRAGGSPSGRGANPARWVLCFCLVACGLLAERTHCHANLEVA